MRKNKLATIMAVCGTGALLLGMAATSSIAEDKMIDVGGKQYPLFR